MSTDTPLVQRARAGDAAAFGTLVRQHQSKVRGFLRRLTRGDAALADDLAQETFLEAHRKLDQFRGEGSFGAWLCGIAWSRFLMERRKRREEPLEAPDETASAPAAGPALEEGDIARITLRLPESLKDAVEGAAATLSVSVNAWLVRAITNAITAAAVPPNPPGRTGRRITGFAQA